MRASARHVLAPVPLPLIYLQIRYPLLKGLRVLFEQPLLLQEFGIVAVCGGLEQTIVQDIPQRFGQGAQHLLLGLPHSSIRVKAQTFLQKQQQQRGKSFRTCMQMFRCLEVNVLTPAQCLLGTGGGRRPRSEEEGNQWQPSAAPSSGVMNG